VGPGDDSTGVRFDKGVKNVEYWRDVKPILDRSCAACHTASGGKEPAGKLVLDDAKIVNLPYCDDVPAPTDRWRWTRPGGSATSRW